MVLEKLCVEPIYPEYSGVLEICLALGFLDAVKVKLPQMTRDGSLALLFFHFLGGRTPIPPFRLMVKIFNQTLLSHHNNWLEVRYSSREVKKIWEEKESSL